MIRSGHRQSRATSRRRTTGGEVCIFLRRPRLQAEGRFWPGSDPGQAGYSWVDDSCSLCDGYSRRERRLFAEDWVTMTGDGDKSDQWSTRRPKNGAGHWSVAEVAGVDRFRTQNSARKDRVRGTNKEDGIFFRYFFSRSDRNGYSSRIPWLALALPRICSCS